MKSFTNAVLSPKQRYYNYRLSRARMVSEGAYGQLKGRWRVLLRKSESNRDQVHITTLLCMVLQNICIMQGDPISKKLDLSNSEKRSREEIRKLLQEIAQVWGMFHSKPAKSETHYVKNYGLKRKQGKFPNY